MKTTKRDRWIATWALVALFTVVGGASAEEIEGRTRELAEGASPAAASIEDLAWMVGYWKGTGLGGVSEELWMPPLEDRMYGTFTLVEEGAVVFTESMMLIENEGSVELRVKHFTPDFVGWEEKDGYVTFPLVALEEGSDARFAYFRGLTFHRAGDRLQIYLVLTQDGVRTEHAFDLARQAL